jgi:hypothetical protein
MSSEPSAPVIHEERIEGVPLYLVPKVIADHIREKRELVFQITASRVREHRYRIVVETFDEHSQRAREVTPAQQVAQAQRREEGGHGNS